MYWPQLVHATAARGESNAKKAHVVWSSLNRPTRPNNVLVVGSGPEPEMNEIVHAAANRHRNSHSNIIYQGGFGGGKASHCRTVSHTWSIYHASYHSWRKSGCCSLLSYDATTALILIVDENKAILVDVSLCVDPWSSAWAREDWATLTTIGYLEASLVGFWIRVLHDNLMAHFRYNFLFQPSQVMHQLLTSTQTLYFAPYWSLRLQIWTWTYGTRASKKEKVYQLV